MNWRSKLRTWRAFCRDARGVAALEFALVVPMVIVVYAGGFEIAQAATVNRKLTDTTVQLANVTSQYTSVAKVRYQQHHGAFLDADHGRHPTTPLTDRAEREVQTDKNGGNGTVTVRSQPYVNRRYLSPGAGQNSVVTLPAKTAMLANCLATSWSRRPTPTRPRSARPSSALSR